jgi:hypothetical protein
MFTSSSKHDAWTAGTIYSRSYGSVFLLWIHLRPIRYLGHSDSRVDLGCPRIDCPYAQYLGIIVVFEVCQNTAGSGRGEKNEAAGTPAQKTNVSANAPWDGRVMKPDVGDVEH